MMAAGAPLNLRVATPASSMFTAFCRAHIFVIRAKGCHGLHAIEYGHVRLSPSLELRGFIVGIECHGLGLQNWADVWGQKLGL